MAGVGEPDAGRKKTPGGGAQRERRAAPPRGDDVIGPGRPGGSSTVKTDLSLLGPCGIYCGTCDIYVACHTGDAETQKKIADWLRENHGADCAPEDIRCGGCHGPLSEHWSADCTILKCAGARAVRTCADCGEYETCTTLDGFYRGGDYESARATLTRIREIGLDAWAAERESSE